ncbi:hypothetical protein CC80DRAFT_497161 [Byssothecium circinans]|uniref:RING-type domain-containing protein n=1 Tax=Byssothecium circinans TaxID=147558 RepID=A0A6A5TB60_9PLEO|nr:hypothetical protein CC80DRAFT_497161 [Byssothecium circinans]
MDPLGKSKARYLGPRPDNDTFATQQEFLDSLVPVEIESVPEGSRTCGYCWRFYGEVTPGEDDAELPVQFKCGHYHGEACAKRLFALPEMTKFKLQPLSFAPGSKGAKLGEALHATIAATKPTGEVDLAGKEKVFRQLVNVLGTQPRGQGVDAEWSHRLLQALTLETNVMNIHILENGIVLDVLRPPTLFGSGPAPFPGPLAASANLFTAAMTAVTSDSSSDSSPHSPDTITEGFVGPFGSKAAILGGWEPTVHPSTMFDIKGAPPGPFKPTVPATPKTEAELVHEIEQIKKKLGSAAQKLQHPKFKVYVPPLPFDLSALVPQTPEGASPTPTLQDAPKPAAELVKELSGLKKKWNMVKKAMHHVVKAHDQEKAAKERAEKQRIHREAQQKTVAVILARSLAKVHDDYVQYQKSAGQQPSLQKREWSLSELSVDLTMASYHALRNELRVTKELHTKDVDAEQYEVSPPYGYRGYESDSVSDGPDDNTPPEYEASAKIVYLTRHSCHKCDVFQGTAIPPVPQYITWQDVSRKAPDDCPLCRKVLFLTDPTGLPNLQPHLHG